MELHIIYGELRAQVIAPPTSLIFLAPNTFLCSHTLSFLFVFFGALFLCWDKHNTMTQKLNYSIIQIPTALYRISKALWKINKYFKWWLNASQQSNEQPVQRVR